MIKYMRAETADEYGIKELQEKILQIVVYIDDVCQKLGLSYCLMGGSALGAVRHQGFIPWDDDLDIFMRPEDYVAFKSFFEQSGDKDNFYLQELLERDGRIASAKLRMNNTTYIEEATQNWRIHQGVFIDIFMLHNTSNKKICRFFQCLSAKYLLAKGQYIKGVKYKGVKRIATIIAGVTPKNFGIKSALRRLYRYDGKTTDYVCHFMGKAFFQEGVYSTNYFNSTKRVQFETVFLNIPGKVHEYLQGRFGDYMKIPQKESIRIAQHALKWDTEKDFSEYVNKERDFSDEKYLV